MALTMENNESLRVSRRKQKSPRKSGINEHTLYSFQSPFELPTPDVKVSAHMINEVSENVSYVLSKEENVSPNDLKESDLCPRQKPTEKLAVVAKKNSLVCKDCNRTFSKWQHLQVHLLLGHKSRVSHECSQCKLRFPYKSLLASHIKATHSIVQYSSNVKEKKFPKGSKRMMYMYNVKHGTPLVDGDFLPIVDGQQIKCINCKELLDDIPKIKAHFLSEHKDWRLTIMCPKCMRIFATTELVEKHLPLCKPLISLRCKQCDLDFETTDEYRAHNQQHHPSNGKFACHLCGKAFRQPYYLTKHLSRRHTEKQLSAHKKRCFSCSCCHRSFITAHGLKSHFVKAHFERPNVRTRKKTQFDCAKCDKIFSTKKKKVPTATLR